MKAVPLRKELGRRPVQLLHTNKDVIARLNISHPRIKDVLDSSGEGFFSRYFDPRNPVQSLRKGLLFNRRIARQDEENDPKSNRVHQRQQAESEEKKLMNCFLEEQSCNLEESVQKEERGTRKTWRKPFHDNQQPIRSLQHDKLSCYELKLSRSKWLTSPNEFCSGDFQRLQIEFPQIKSLSKNYLKKTSVGEMDLKPGLQSVLDPVVFSQKSPGSKQLPVRKTEGDTQKDCVPFFLLRKLKLESMARRPDTQQSTLPESPSTVWKKGVKDGKCFIENNSTRISIQGSQILGHSKFWTEPLHSSIHYE